MRVLDWIRSHKARSGLIVVALINLLYLVWCLLEDTPTSSFSKVITPVLILSVVFFDRPSGRTTR